MKKFIPFMLILGVSLPVIAMEHDVEMGVRRPVNTTQPSRILDPESLEEILLYPEECVRQSKIVQWWNRLSRVKKDAVELLGMLGIDIATEVYRYFSGNDSLSWLVGYAVGKQVAQMTERYAYWKKISVALALWGIGGLTYFMMYNAETLGASIVMYMVHTTFEEYAKKTGRSIAATTDFRDMPSDLQQQLVTNIKSLC